MGLTLKEKKQVKPILINLYKDFRALKDGTWEPDESSCNSSMESVMEVAAYLGIPITHREVKEED